MTLGTSIFILICLIFIFNCPKQFLVLFLVILGLIIAGWLLYVLKESNDKAKEKATNDSIKINITYDTEKCFEEYPLLVQILNYSNKTVHKVTWQFSVYNSGYSNDISKWHDDYEIYKILRPGEEYSSCYKVPELYYSLPLNREELRALARKELARRQTQHSPPKPVDIDELLAAPKEAFRQQTKKVSTSRVETDYRIKELEQELDRRRKQDAQCIYKVKNKTVTFEEEDHHYAP